MMTHGVKFLKPGEDWQNDRPDIDSETGSTFVFNPNISMAIESQRQKLPVFRNRSHIIHLLEKHQVLVLVGETGCGKSTQIPQYLYECGWGEDGVIGVTEPRRIAATMLATRVSEERGCQLGGLVGYKIRFDDCTSASTKIKFMTNGILVREMMQEPLLKQYCVIILDEVHERTLYTDIALGLLRKILKKRPHLRVVVCSATMDAEFFKDYFAVGSTKEPAAILSVEGRTYPVEIHYLKEPTPNYIEAACSAVLDIAENEELGDVLVFLTGQEDVDAAVRMIRDNIYDVKKYKNIHIFPLYSSLPAGEQLKAFHRLPHGQRKVIMSTNIAETALTIPGVVYVIDSGVVKLRRYDSKALQESLVVVPISKSAAIQRAGRAGRVRSGKAYRLYPEEEFEKLTEDTPPEMMRCDLCPLILELKALGVDNPLRFRFPSPPPAIHMVTALNLLYAMEAIDDSSNLTVPLGRRMAELPLPPLLSKLLLASDKFECVEEAAAIVAMLQVKDIWQKPRGKWNEAKAMHRNFQVEEGDLVSLLNVFTSFMSGGCKRGWCDQHYVNYKSLSRALSIRNHILTTLRRYEIEQSSADGDCKVVCRCLTAGLFVNAAQLHYTGQYYSYLHSGQSLYLHPDSVLNHCPKPPQWVIFTEVLQTSKDYMQNVTAIEEEWLLEMAPHFYEKVTKKNTR